MIWLWQDWYKVGNSGRHVGEERHEGVDVGVGGMWGAMVAGHYSPEISS